MENKLAKNRKSPKNEIDYINAYLQKNPTARRKDGLDIAAVITKGGIKGHALMPEAHNRSRDDKLHRVTDFIPDSELKKIINSKK